MLTAGFAPAAKAAALEGRGGIIHFEIQPKNVNKVVETQIPVLGDVVASLAELVPQLESVDRSEWLNKIQSNKEKYPFAYTPSSGGEKLKPQEVVRELNVQAEAIGSELSTTVSADVQRRTLSSPPVLDSIKCGHASITDGPSLDLGFPPEV